MMVGVTVGGFRWRLRSQALECGCGGQQPAEPCDRVDARLGHRPMGHLAAHAKPRPDDTALLEAQLVLLRLADDRGIELAPDRRGAEVPHADHAVLLVHQRAHHQLAPQRHARPLDGRRSDHRGGQPALHVRGPPAVDPVVHEIGRERQVRPLGGIALGYHVGVALEEEATSAGAPFAEPADDVGSPRSDRLHLDREVLAPEPAFDEGGDLGLGRGGIPGPVDTRDADEGSRQLHHLVRIDLAEDLRQRGHSQSGAVIRSGTTG
jgi:hypothetical protein